MSKTGNLEKSVSRKPKQEKIMILAGLVAIAIISIPVLYIMPFNEMESVIIEDKYSGGGGFLSGPNYYLKLTNGASMSVNIHEYNEYKIGDTYEYSITEGRINNVLMCAVFLMLAIGFLFFFHMLYEFSKYPFF